MAANKKLYRNITSRTLTTPSGEDWPSGELASLTEAEAGPRLAYKEIHPVGKKKTPESQPSDPPAT